MCIIWRGFRNVYYIWRGFHNVDYTERFPLCVLYEEVSVMCSWHVIC